MLMYLLAMYISPIFAFQSDYWKSAQEAKDKHKRIRDHLDAKEEPRQVVYKVPVQNTLPSQRANFFIPNTMNTNMMPVYTTTPQVASSHKPIVPLVFPETNINNFNSN